MAENPAGCVDVDEHEQHLTELADKLEAESLALLSDHEKANRLNKSVANQLALSSIRARRAAAELAGQRKEREHSAMLLREYQKLHGLGGPNRETRVPLRRKAS